MTTISRRNFLKLGGVGLASVAGALLFGRTETQAAHPNRVPMQMGHGEETLPGTGDVD